MRPCLPISILFAGWAVLSGCRTAGPTIAKPIPIKVVVVSLFEVGEDTGDTPGEFQFWVERERLTNSHPVTGAWRPAREGADGLIGFCTGVGNVRAAASITALGLDPRYDLRQAYWVVAGIAGIDPADGSLGSAAWAEHVVDGDLAHEIDAREIPADWPDGYLPLGQATPSAPPSANRQDKVHYPLDRDLAHWAFGLTRDTPLADNEVMQKNRARYVGFPQAQRPPFVLMGDTLSGSTFWHGALLNRWANRWVKHNTAGAGSYVTTAMEESGVMQALTWLGRDGRVDPKRVLVLRTASNFDSPPPGMSAADSLAEENGGKYSAYLPSLEAAHAVGSRVVHELISNWPRYATQPPKP
jgi:purine nucleoside permease